METDRRSALLAMKLTALVRDHVGSEFGNQLQPSAAGFGRGAGIVVGSTAWVLLDSNPERGLGAALAWALRQPGVTELAVIAESASGTLLRRGQLFDFPISVWGALERVLVPAVSAPYVDQPALEEDLSVYKAQIEAAGADACFEYGVLTGEVRGLEVCRVITDPESGAIRLEVGVGAHDRDAYVTMHPNRSVDDALRSVVASVLAQREPGKALHPLNRLGAERFIRWQVLQDPARVDASWLKAVSGTAPRPNVKDHFPCIALGESRGGAPIVVACSSGVDLDLVPAAADARALHSPSATLVLVAPERDLLAITRALAERVIPGPCQIIAWH